MTHPFRARRNNPITWFEKDRANSNQLCPYCGRIIGAGSEIPFDKDHLIGRRFVPKRMLDGNAFNFLFGACIDCNNGKSEAEGHIAAVTLFTSPGRAEDPEINAEAVRKATGDYHPIEKGKRVCNAHVQQSLKYSFGAATFEFQMHAPPQLAEGDVCLVAGRQVQALFFLITNSNPLDPAATKRLQMSNIHILGYFPENDWGNPWLVEMTRRIKNWKQYLGTHSAQGYFKAVMYCTDDEDEEWFWALEWNRSYRVLGAIAKKDGIPRVFADLPSLGWQRLPDNTGRTRLHVPAPKGDDELFTVVDHGVDSAAA
jgi:hypothetical protein